ncbi:MAG: RNA-directed DNA polymerase [Chloroflexi bacterium]|nr:RNA-directed DNA polymerase [Chloroflexota bacterium]
MPTIRGLITRGYFPVELPPAFSSHVCGNVLHTSAAHLPRDFNLDKASKNVAHNLLKYGTQRRRLGIPNPTNYFRLARFVSVNWNQLITIATQSPLSLTTPASLRPPSRALVRRIKFPVKEERKALVRSRARYILTADISQFYHSVYTHSIPWAIHGKAASKAQRNNRTLLGNAFDKLIRASQDGQSVGIPIGPDISLLIAEIILNDIDMKLIGRGLGNAFRMIDDYEFGCDSLVQAETAREYLQELLSEYELNLNNSKTRIEELPQVIETLCVSQLRAHQINSAGSMLQKRQLIHYFDLAFTFLRECPKIAVLKYAVSRLDNVVVDPANWAICQHLLMQCMVVDPSTIKTILNQIIRYRGMGYPIDGGLFQDGLNSVIEQHAIVGHASEVAWSIWALLVLNLHLSDSAADRAANMNDSIVALLVLDAHAKGLTNPGVNFANYQSYMTNGDLYCEHWLLAYEANVKRWLPSVGRADHVSGDRCFSFLKASGVFFYDDTASRTAEYEPYEPPADILY